MKQSVISAPTNGIPILPTVLKDMEPQIAQHRQDLSEMQSDILSKSELLREFLSQYSNHVRQIDVNPDSQEVHAVDCATLTVTAGEFTSLLALGVNVSDRDPSWFKRDFIQVSAPNSDAFGSSNTAFAAIAELRMLDQQWSGKCFYDGSFQSLNFNLGNFFKLADLEAPEEADFEQYISNLKDLFDSVTEIDSKRNSSLYSRVFNHKRTDLIAVSKRSSSSYIVNKLRELYSKKRSKTEIDTLLAQLQFKQNISDKLLLQPILKPGEVFGPLSFSEASGKQGLRKNAQGDDAINDKARKDFFGQLKFVFYRPHTWSPVYRIEYVAEKTKDKEVLEQQLQEVLAIVKYQTRIIGILEIEAIYLADKVSKQVAALKDIYGYSNFQFFHDLFSPNRTEEI